MPLQCQVPVCTMDVTKLLLSKYRLHHVARLANCDLWSWLKGTQNWTCRHADRRSRVWQDEGHWVVNELEVPVSSMKSEIWCVERFLPFVALSVEVMLKSNLSDKSICDKSIANRPIAHLTREWCGMTTLAHKHRDLIPLRYSSPIPLVVACGLSPENGERPYFPSVSNARSSTLKKKTVSCSTRIASRT